MHGSRTWTQVQHTYDLSGWRYKEWAVSPGKFSVASCHLSQVLLRGLPCCVGWAVISRKVTWEVTITWDLFICLWKTSSHWQIKNVCVLLPTHHVHVPQSCKIYRKYFLKERIHKTLKDKNEFHQQAKIFGKVLKERKKERVRWITETKRENHNSKHIQVKTTTEAGAVPWRSKPRLRGDMGWDGAWEQPLSEKGAAYLEY